MLTTCKAAYAVITFIAVPSRFNSYDIAMIGPLYRQLVGHWDGTETPASEVDGDKIERFAGRACFAAG
jgi:hypothetical protein